MATNYVQNQSCQWCNQPLIGSQKLSNCTNHIICNKCKINNRSCQSACPCCWYINVSEFISKNTICPVCRSNIKSNVETSDCYHQHKHCACCSSSGCILCKFIQLRSWVNSSFDDLPMDIKPILVICDDWEKKFEEELQLKTNSLIGFCERQDSSFMDIDESSPVVQSSNLLKSNTQTMESINCPICLDELGPPYTTLSICQHSFHDSCIKQWIQSSGKQTCPTCGYIYGLNKGPQPPHGQMTITYISTPLSGFSIEQYASNEGPTIEITYTIPSGIQGPLNSYPGQPYTGTVRKAYLPNNSEGKYVLQLLRKAFDDQHIFTIGKSATRGLDNAVIWNDIHHKTNISGGAEHFGYPDPTYLLRVRQELADKDKKKKMAASYWKSSQFEQWLFDRQELMSVRLRDIASWPSSNGSSSVTEDDYMKILIFYSNIIQSIGEQYKVRQQVIATAIIYLKRFYARYPLKSIDPWLLCPTCLFLAAKVEEFSTLNHQRVCNAASTVYKKFAHILGGPNEYPYQIKHILECEFYLLEIMDCCLIIYHPYRSLDTYTREFQIDQPLFEATWRIINDSLKTDAPLLYPPYEIALACIVLAARYRDKVGIIRQYMIEAQIDVERIYDIVKLVLQYYELLTTYDADLPHNDGKKMKEILAKIPKPKVTPIGSTRPSSQPNEKQLQLSMQQ
ncbi:unnamed protein product [Rotaria socialis]|uniref:E3 ubiquitin-protein ligase n=2 Tax=Rotaria socialis TaxID=392032 RepID=A0A818BDP1_9BILA|nr:unnamed protein product [Rotaria socialis]